jgi:hypothetical protein
MAGMKVQWDEGGGSIPLGDNAVGEAVMLRPIRFQCTEVWISAGLLYVFDYMYTDLRKIDLLRIFRNVITG